MEAVNWRTKLSNEQRAKVVDDIVNKFMKLVPSAKDNISDLKNLAVKFEEKVFMIATDEKDYGKKIILKMLAIRKSPQNVVPSTSSSSLSCPNITGQSLAVTSTDQSQEHSMPNSIPSNFSSPGVSSMLASALVTSSISNQVPLSDSASNNSCSQTSIGNTSGHGELFNVSAKRLKVEEGRQHSSSIHTQQRQNLPHFKQVKLENIVTQQYHEQLNPHLCNQLKEVDTTTAQRIKQENQLLHPHNQQKPFKPTQEFVMQDPLIRPSETHVPFSDLHHSQNHQMSSSDKTSQSVIKNHPHRVFRQTTPQDSLGIHQTVTSKPETLLMQSQKQHHLEGRRLTATNNSRQQNQAQIMNLSSVHHEKVTQRNNSFVQPTGTQGTRSSMHHGEIDMQGGTQRTASSLLPNQGISTQPQNLKRQQNPAEGDQQQTHQVSGMSTFRKEEIHRKVEILKAKYFRPLTGILRKLTEFLQNLDKGDIKKREQYSMIYQTVKLILTKLNGPESKSLNQEYLCQLENKIIEILHKCGLQKLVSSFSDTRQNEQLHSQTSQAQSHQDEKPRSQPVNIQCVATTIHQRNLSNLVIEVEPTVRQHDRTLSRNKLTENDLDQEDASKFVRQCSSGKLQNPSSSQHQDGMSLLSQNPVRGPQSNVKPYETGVSTPRGVHLKHAEEQSDMQTQNPKQNLQLQKTNQQLMMPKKKTLQQLGQPVKLQSEAFPNPSPKVYNSSRLHVSDYSSQVEKSNLAMPLTEPSMKNSSLTPLAPRPGNSEKPMADTPFNSNAGNIGNQQVKGAPEAPQSSVISTPGLSASPLLEAPNDDIRCNNSTFVDVSQPIQKLINMVNRMSSKALTASALEIGSVVCLSDIISEPAPVQGSRGAIYECFEKVPNFRLQGRYSAWQKVYVEPRIMKQPSRALPISDMEEFDLESTEICHIKRPRLEANKTLLEEIRSINQRLIDTVLDITDKETAPPVASSPSANGEGTIVRCSFIPVTISPLNLMSDEVSARMFPLQPLRLLVPANYPLCSPILLDELTMELSNEPQDLSAKVISQLNISLRSLMEPFSLGEIATSWDRCARAVISEVVEENGGGSFSSKYGTWEDCLSVA